MYARIAGIIKYIKFVIISKIISYIIDSFKGRIRNIVKKSILMRNEQFSKCIFIYTYEIVKIRLKSEIEMVILIIVQCRLSGAHDKSIKKRT